MAQLKSVILFSNEATIYLNCLVNKHRFPPLEVWGDISFGCFSLLLPTFRTRTGTLHWLGLHPTLQLLKKVNQIIRKIPRIFPFRKKFLLLPISNRSVEVADLVYSRECKCVFYVAVTKRQNRPKSAWPSCLAYLGMGHSLTYLHDVCQVTQLHLKLNELM